MTRMEGLPSTAIAASTAASSSFSSASIRVDRSHRSHGSSHFKPAAEDADSDTELHMHELQVPGTGVHSGIEIASSSTATATTGRSKRKLRQVSHVSQQVSISATSMSSLHHSTTSKLQGSEHYHQQAQQQQPAAETEILQIQEEMNHETKNTTKNKTKSRKKSSHGEGKHSSSRTTNGNSRYEKELRRRSSLSLHHKKERNTPQNENSLSSPSSSSPSSPQQLGSKQRTHPISTKITQCYHLRNSPIFQSKRSLDDSVVVDCLSIARTRHASFLPGKQETTRQATTQTISKPHTRLLEINSCSAPSILDVTDIGYQTEEVMGVLRDSAAADLRYSTSPEQKRHSSLQFIDAGRTGLNKKSQSDVYSLTQNLHNAILQHYTKTSPQPHRHQASTKDVACLQLTDLDSQHFMLPALPMLSTYHTSMTSLLDESESSCCSLDPYDLASTALSRALDIGPMEHLYASMTRMGHDWSKDGDEFNERLYSSAPVHFRRGTFQLDPASFSQLPPLPNIHTDKESATSSMRHQHSLRLNSAVEEYRRCHDRQSGKSRRRRESSTRNRSNLMGENVPVLSQQQERVVSRDRRKHSRRQDKTES